MQTKTVIPGQRPVIQFTPSLFGTRKSSSKIRYAIIVGETRGALILIRRTVGSLGGSCPVAAIAVVTHASVRG